MKDLNPYKVHGPDDISSYVLKDYAEMLNRPHEKLNGSSMEEISTVYKVSGREQRSCIFVSKPLNYKPAKFY